MSKALASRRYVLLIDQLGDELGKVYGWQSRVARRLGVSHVVVNRLVRRERTSVGLDVIERAVRRLHLSRDYFYDAALGEAPDYREHARGRMQSDPTEAAVNEYLAGEGAHLPEPVKGELRMLWIDGIEVTPDVIRAIAERLLIRYSTQGARATTRVMAVPGGDQ